MACDPSVDATPPREKCSELLVRRRWDQTAAAPAEQTRTQRTFKLSPASYGNGVVICTLPSFPALAYTSSIQMWTD